MTKREFEEYLALLCGLLRLRGGRRDEIVSELRDHLEERLQELIDGGASPQQAVSTALRELGDTAELAGRFTEVIQNSRKRWLMRCTTLSVGLVFVSLMALAALWPDSPQAPSRAVAQSAGQPEASDLPGGLGRGAGGLLGGGQSGRVARKRAAGKKNRLSVVEERLATLIRAEFIESPLKDVIEQISDQTELQFFIKQNYLEDIGVELQEPVTIQLDNVKASLVLDLVFEPLNLAYYARDEIVIVTSMDDLESSSEVRVYNCRDLLNSPPATGMGGGMGAMMGMEGGAMGGMGGGAMGGDAGGMDGGGYRPAFTHQAGGHLINLLTTTVMPDSWVENGGPGSIAEYNGLLVVSHDSQAHRMIERVLDMLRTANDRQPGETVRDR